MSVLRQLWFQHSDETVSFQFDGQQVEKGMHGMEQRISHKEHRTGDGRRTCGLPIVADEHDES